MAVLPALPAKQFRQTYRLLEILQESYEKMCSFCHKASIVGRMM